MKGIFDMSTLTNNYGLEKPAQTDFYNVDVFNANADIIDEELSKSVKGEGLEFSISDNTLNATHESGASAQIADKPTLDEILALLENTTYGLNALKTLISSSGVDLTPVTSRLDNTTYGLNALNTDIDNVQSALNNSTYGLNALKTAISGRANESTLTTTKALLENTTYGLSAIKTYVDTLESVIGTTTNTGGSASAGTVMAKLNALFTLISSSGGIPGTVKSVQRGYTSGGEYDDDVTITINTINPNKAIVILNASMSQHADSGQVHTPYVVSLTSTVLTVGNHYTPHDAEKFSWQVIEFY